MYQVISIINWQSKEAGDEAHRKIWPRILDRWEEMAPSGAEAFLMRCSDRKTVYTAIFPSSRGVKNDSVREKLRKVIEHGIRDLNSDDGLLILDGDVEDKRTRM